MMMSDYKKCIVPTCENPSNVGIPLPQNEHLKQKWLTSLKLDELDIIGNIICINHFDNGQFLQKNTAGLLDDYEKLPIPIVKTDVENNLEEAKTHCRLCMSDECVQIDIHDIFEATDIEIASIITTCIPGLKLAKKGTCTKICTKCYETIRDFHKFRTKCLEIDKEHFKKRPFIQSFNRPSKKIKVTKSGVKLEQVEAQVMQVLESQGKLTNELKEANNFLIEVHDDEENDQNEAVPKVKSAPKVKSDPKVRVVKLGTVTLPSDIKVTRTSTKIGRCASEKISGIDNTEFCIADGYLFEYGLYKNNKQQLKCTTTRCRCRAEQFSTDEVDVLSAHNHPPPSRVEMKKLTFLHEIRKRMQGYKNTNFRAIYDEFTAKDPDLIDLMPLRNVVHDVCRAQMSPRNTFNSFHDFYECVEERSLEKLHFTHDGKQFYQDKLAAEDGTLAVVFGNKETADVLSNATLMYVDASFRLGTQEQFDCHLVTFLVWTDDYYHPILFALISDKTLGIYRELFQYVRDRFAPRLRPTEVVTDYESSLYYALGEIYAGSNIGGSVFYYTMNLYKKTCSLGLSQELETNSGFRNIYQLLLMLPLLPVNTVSDAFVNIRAQAEANCACSDLAEPLLDHVQSEWLDRVTPELFCVHRLENRLNENVMAPFKKLRDFLLLSKGKMQKQLLTVVSVVEKLQDAESYLRLSRDKKSFTRDLSSTQKKNVIKAWQFIEDHPKIDINNFFVKVLGYIKCMENQLWIWGFYRCQGVPDDDLISAANFSIVDSDEKMTCEAEESQVQQVVVEETEFMQPAESDSDGVHEFLSQIGYGKF